MPANVGFPVPSLGIDFALSHRHIWNNTKSIVSCQYFRFTARLARRRVMMYDPPRHMRERASMKQGHGRNICHRFRFMLQSFYIFY